MLAKLDRYFEEVLCTIFLCVVVGSVLMQVIMRFVFHSAAAWAEETAVYGMIFAVYLGATMATRERAHIRISLLVSRLPRKPQVGCIVLADALWTAFVVFMIVQTTKYTNLLFSVTFQTPGLGIEQRWIQMFIPILFGLMLFRIAQVYWRWSRENFKGLPL
ncbi:TRAP-type C4-dicarboxylate transport system, small permease component [Ruegeria halocynthiae]|uniref:TRAP transporter small permease protein n=1 Tax=Ruegeria halocynthiae TaxID=985054 RepID=A0A1H3F8A3_9RHOB|nr:TRAP transporter small permease [Ruegeria halocynthiae]SDX86379.1 TRAP-type C4-dicarboxylate transport system, small permease component [Ruegeria halocynthiae]